MVEVHSVELSPPKAHVGCSGTDAKAITFAFANPTKDDFAPTIRFVKVKTPTRLKIKILTLFMIIDILNDYKGFGIMPNETRVSSNNSDICLFVKGEPTNTG